MAKVEKRYEATCDFLTGDQFLDSFNRELFVYFKPKTFKSFGDMAKGADHLHCKKPG